MLLSNIVKLLSERTIFLYAIATLLSHIAAFIIKPYVDLSKTSTLRSEIAITQSNIAALIDDSSILLSAIATPADCLNTAPNLTLKSNQFSMINSNRT